jgi:hypothetical protein
MHTQRPYDDDSPIAMRNFSATPMGQHVINQQPVPREIVPVPPPIPKPILKVLSENVLASASQSERNHLGSVLYEVKFITPPHASTPLYDKWGYAMQYKPNRRFTDSDENCTLTVRVPRDFLTAEMREKLCTDRYVFGTEVFTDDSDPLLAAMHSGWIRGSWPSEIDTSLMDLPPPPPADAPIVSELTAPPAEGPVLPPPNMDCHITILILPALVKYATSLRFGIRSRQWGDNHDGSSFMVTGVKWVDEGLERTSQRPGKAKKARAANDSAENGLSKAEAKRRKVEVAVEA